MSVRRVADVRPILLVSNRYYIRNISLDGNQISLVASDLINAVALDYDWAERRIYWSDVTSQNSSIQRMHDDGTHKEVGGGGGGGERGWRGGEGERGRGRGEGERGEGERGRGREREGERGRGRRPYPEDAGRRDAQGGGRGNEGGRGRGREGWRERGEQRLREGSTDGTHFIVHFGNELVNCV